MEKGWFHEAKQISDTQQTHVCLQRPNLTPDSDLLPVCPISLTAVVTAIDVNAN